MMMSSNIINEQKLSASTSSSEKKEDLDDNDNGNHGDNNNVKKKEVVNLVEKLELNNQFMLEEEHNKQISSNPIQSSSNKSITTAITNSMFNDKTWLLIRKIPPKLNTIGSLDKHFSKFGTVVNIQVSLSIF